MLFGELKRVVDLLSQENNKTKNYQDKMTNYLVGLSKESEVIRKKVEDEILKVVDSKVGTILERLKKEDQELWQKTLEHVNNNFKDAARKKKIVVKILLKKIFQNLQMVLKSHPKENYMNWSLKMILIKDLC